MHIISMKALREFWELHPDAEKPLREWFKTAEKEPWRNLIDARKYFPHADGVDIGGSTVTVFNVAGNKYRVVARVYYEYGKAYVLKVMTHAEYSKDRWKAELHNRLQG